MKTNLRWGFATNSSSSHSFVVYKEDSTEIQHEIIRILKEGSDKLEKYIGTEEFHAIFDDLIRYKLSPWIDVNECFDY